MSHFNFKALHHSKSPLNVFGQLETVNLFIFKGFSPFICWIPRSDQKSPGFLPSLQTGGIASAERTQKGKLWT